MKTLAVGIDLGATKIAAALVGDDGTILATRQLPTAPVEGIDPVLNRLGAIANDLCREANTLPGRLLGIGIGSPGLVDPQTGTVENAVNLGWDKVHLAREIQSRLEKDLPIWVQKDANAIAIGEYVFGAAKNCPDFLHLTIGTGLGGGLLVGGHLVYGANKNATELGHISLDLQGRQCVCGLRGCAETYLSGQGLVAVCASLRASGQYQTSLTSADITSADILRAATSQDALALAALDEMGKRLGMVIAFCAAVTNPALVVIGGGLGLAAFDLIMPAARKELEARVLKASHINLRIVPSQQASSALGAASLVWYFGNEKP